MKIIKLPLTVFLVVGFVLAGLLGQVAIDSYATNELPSVTIAKVGIAQAQGADLNCDGVDDDVQWQAAADYLSSGGQIVDLCGTTYTFGATVALGNGDMTIQGAGGKSYFENNGSTALFSDGGNARVLFKDFRTDGGGVTCAGTHSYRQNVWIGSTYYFEGPAGGSGGSGNCTEVIKTVTGDAGSYGASDCFGAIQIASGSGLLTAVAGAVLTVSADATMTRDVEWDTIGEIEAATSVNIIVSTEVDSEAELETLLAGVTDVFTDNDLIPEANLDVANAPTDEYSLTWEADDGKPRWQLISGGGGGGNCSVAIATFGGDSGSDYTASSCSGAIAVIGGSDISTVSDGAGNVTVSAAATLTRDTEWDTIGEIEAATSVNIIIYGEIDTEAELEAILSDVSNLIVSTEIDSEADLEALIGDAVIVDGEIDTEAELEAMLIGVTDVFTDNDTIDFSDYINATAGEGIDFSDDEILAETATASNLGIAMFFVQHFGLAAGNVTIAADAIDDTLIDWGSGANQVDTDDIPEGSTNKFEGTTAGDYLTLTVEDIDHDPVLRYMPEIFTCSMSGNTSTSIGDCESVDFGGIEFHVVEFTAGDMAFFHIKTPATFGYGGNTTMTVSYGVRVEDGSSGSSLIMATKIGTSITDALTEDWHNSSGLAWSQNDEITWTTDLVIDESLGSGAIDLVIGIKLVSEDWDATNIYVDKVIYQAWGV